MWDFDEVYREHLQAVFRFALHQVGRRELAEDITSEAFLTLYRNRHTVDPAQLPAWLFTVARNRAVDHWRKWSKEQSFAENPVKASPSASPKQTSFEELLDHPSLKPTHRVCLVLRFMYGLSREEIAEETGLSPYQVKGYLQYALQLLRKGIGQVPR